MMGLETIYFLCLGFGVLCAFISLLFGDSQGHVSGHFHLPVFQPLSLISGITALGGSGVILTRFTALAPLSIFLLSILVGFVFSFAAYFIWIKPMKHAETSTGYSVYQLVGRIGEVLTTIPASGIGEIVITMVNGRTNHMAASFEQVTIPEGKKVVVVEVVDHVLYVTPFDEEEKE